MWICSDLMTSWYPSMASWIGVFDVFWISYRTQLWWLSGSHHLLIEGQLFNIVRCATSQPVTFQTASWQYSSTGKPSAFSYWNDVQETLLNLDKMNKSPETIVKMGVKFKANLLWYKIIGHSCYLFSFLWYAQLCKKNTVQIYYCSLKSRHNKILAFYCYGLSGKF